ncbi:MAG: hypothetical protein MPJ04_01060 [Nitrosopumilus sp.]|nr:hypothetical protein [Nitrosopumilus sp.]MDA7944402.1 hypothetical protein [Nitrosopumilus sp.]MDA7954154.1 hypothetical protein [Nitrosopumilus sp.]MDA7960593.1 hypothetical protein [Nitrosopumilus sp.]MDA7996488.1 hypothetical protein [Nitrosopumilus sp.]
MNFISVIMLIDTNIWIDLYEAGLTWVIREIVKLPGHEVWITGCVRRELDNPEYGGVHARTDGMFDDGTVVTGRVPRQDPSKPSIYKKAEDEMIALVEGLLGKESGLIVTNDDQALGKCRIRNIRSLDMAKFLIWCCEHGVLGRDDAVDGFDDLAKDGPVLKISRQKFIDEISRSPAPSRRGRAGKSRGDGSRGS